MPIFGLDQRGAQPRPEVAAEVIDWLSEQVLNEGSQKKIAYKRVPITQMVLQHGEEPRVCGMHDDPPSDVSEENMREQLVVFALVLLDQGR